MRGPSASLLPRHPANTCHPPSGILANATFFAVLCLFVVDFMVVRGPQAQRSQNAGMCLTQKDLCSVSFLPARVNGAVGLELSMSESTVSIRRGVLKQNTRKTRLRTDPLMRIV